MDVRDSSIFINATNPLTPADVASVTATVARYIRDNDLTDSDELLILDALGLREEVTA